MRSSRLVAIVLELQRTVGATAQTLADRFEVSVRTIYRDIAALQEAGVPIWTESGPRGGIRLLDGWSGRLDGLTADELDAMALAGAPAVAADLGLGALVAAAQAKVLDTMPPELRGRASRVRERFLLDAPGWFHNDDPTDHLSTIAGCVWNGARLDITYPRGDRTVARRLDPLGLVIKAGTWYLVAAHRGRPRTYRVGRVRSAVALDERFDRPADFDLTSWWNASAIGFDHALLREVVRVRLDATAARRLRHVVGHVSADMALAAASPPDQTGWIVTDLRVESEEVALGQLVALGPGIEVLSPPSLRSSLAALGAALSANNRAV